LLIGLLALLGCLRASAGRLGFGFLLCDVLLGVGLVLLGLALADHVVTTGHGADRFLGLALHVLDGALDAFLGTTVLLSHIHSSVKRIQLGIVPTWWAYTGRSSRALGGFPLARGLNSDQHRPTSCAPPS